MRSLLMMLLRLRNKYASAAIPVPVAELLRDVRPGAFRTQVRRGIYPSPCGDLPLRVGRGAPASRADDYALPGTIVSPFHHKDVSSSKTRMGPVQEEYHTLVPGTSVSSPRGDRCCRLSLSCCPWETSPQRGSAWPCAPFPRDPLSRLILMAYTSRVARTMMQQLDEIHRAVQRLGPPTPLNTVDLSCLV